MRFLEAKGALVALAADGEAPADAERRPLTVAAAEGTLGGLVEAADRIGDYLRQALDLGRLCANDPVCAHHQPDNQEEERLLLGAACHGCLLLSESSCEKRNDFLDRALVIPTVDEGDAAFFPDEV